MNEIIVLEELPIVFTKELGWGENVKIRAGAIVVLPKDAVLAKTPPKDTPGGKNE